MSKNRNYDQELDDSADAHHEKYAYGFDFDVMHGYMMKSFAPFFKPGKVLELGSFKGAFTRRLLPYFEDVTCVEASQEAIQEAQTHLPARVKFVNSVFEQAQLNEKFQNIVFTHVLEHIDDPVQILQRVREQWLAPEGRLFLVCPNANAASRQLAVKMGLISHNAAVTEAEFAHGHRRTYSLDTLERDVKAAGFHVAHRSGIFFKALANFQWDRLLQTDIVSPAYVEACYDLGLSYPDLCASIFLLCEHPAAKAE
jgi:2-polyprenyl-3-methyl-5-hydroxy-6-metoxy-1,4-benzoquinol methylase